MNRIPLYLAIFGLVSLSFYLIFNSQKISDWIQPPVLEKTSSQSLLGQVLSTSGSVFLDKKEIKKKPTPIHHLDKIQVENRSQATIELTTGDQVQLKEKTVVIVEAWDEKRKNSPLYLNILRGEYKLIKKGHKGYLYVLKDKKLFSPKAPLQKAPSQLIIQSPKDPHLKAYTPPEKKSFSIAPTRPRPFDQRPSTETLSNDYIDQVIAARRDDFQRCQANSLRNNKTSTGELLIGLTISPRGLVKETKILQSTFKNNPEFEECILTVFERCRFKNFSPPEIVRSYPLVFE